MNGPALRRIDKHSNIMSENNENKTGTNAAHSASPNTHTSDTNKASASTAATAPAKSEEEKRPRIGESTTTGTSTPAGSSTTEHGTPARDGNKHDQSKDSSKPENGNAVKDSNQPGGDASRTVAEKAPAPATKPA